MIEVVSGKTLGAYLTERILAPLRMTDTGFYIDAERGRGRLAEAFANDPWTGEKVSHWSMTEKPALGSRRRRTCCHRDGLRALRANAGRAAARSTASASSAGRRWS